MTDTPPSKVFLFDNSDPAMQKAHELARANFRYFWREVHWERRRIIPGLEVAAVKAPFSDGEERDPNSENPDVEHMWLNDVDFDGHYITGVLMNAPNWLTTVKQGNSARVPLAEISDWMYVCMGEVFGAYTVNLMRSRMGPQEQRKHDEAWGLNFGDPTRIRVCPAWKKEGGLLNRWFGQRSSEADEHPMSVNAAPSYQEQLSQDPSSLTYTDDKGWTLLHQEALAGSAPTVKVLLEAGADPNAQTPEGITPLQLARSLDWDKVVALLQS